MKDIAIYGAGGYGRETACLINAINETDSIWNLIGFFDDGLPIGHPNEYGEILGGISELNNYPKELSIVMAIANPIVLHAIITKIDNPLIQFPNIIAPNVLFLDKMNIHLGQGNIIGFKSSLSCNVRIGDFNRLNTNVAFGHDVVVGNYNMFNPSSQMSGDVTIGNCNFFGVNSVVLQQKKIGNNTIIGANSVIMRKTVDGETYIGNPAMKFKY